LAAYYLILHVYFEIGDRRLQNSAFLVRSFTNGPTGRGINGFVLCPMGRTSETAFAGNFSPDRLVAGEFLFCDHSQWLENILSNQIKDSVLNERFYPSLSPALLYSGLPSERAEAMAYQEALTKLVAS
jgi:hypothetical protein